MMSLRRPSALLLLAVFLVSAFLPAVSVQVATAAAPATISVRIVPSTLPADGQAYPALYISLVDPSGLPSAALTNVTVYLSNSAPAVGTVLNSSVVIGFGKEYAIAYFQTTPTSGSTVITATATGYTAGTATLTTSQARGFPSSIILTPVPSQINSTTTSSRSGILIVEFQDPAGQPAKAVMNTPVNVFSSSPQILVLNQTSFTMKTGELLKVLSFTTGFVPGSAVVTASAPQLGTGAAQVTVLGRPPLALKLYAQPSEMVVSGQGRLVIALTDLDGKPARAPTAIVVQLRSSGPNYVSTAQTQVVIPAGSIYASVGMTSGPTPSCSNLCDAVEITASASGLTSGFATVTTHDPGTISDPLALTLNLAIAPSPVLADHGNYSVVEISLVNGSGIPVLAPSPFNIILTSSHNSTAGNFGPNYYTEMTLPAGSNNVIWSTSFTSSYTAGISFLTASSQGVLPATGTITTFGPVPSRIAINSLFGAVPADGAAHPALQVSLEDASGSPAVAPAPVVIYLASSQTGIAKVSSPITIDVGDSAAVVNVMTTSVSGFANVTAYTYSLSSGYAAAATLIQTVIPSPSTIGASLAMSSFSPSPFQNGTSLVLQLQDASGNPAKARVPTFLTVTSSDASVYNETLQVQIPQGTSYVVVPIVPRTSGSTTLTITSPGLTTGAAQLQVLASPFSVQVSSTSASINADQTAVVTLTVSLDGVGIGNLEVSWSATRGVISPPTAMTNPNGQALATLKPTVTGIVIVNAVVNIPHASPQNANTAILVNSASSSTNQGLVGTLISFPYVLVLVAVAAMVAVALFLLLRRRRRAAEAEGALDEEASFSFYDGRQGTMP